VARFYLGAESELLELSDTALLFFFYATPLMGLNLVVANLFQAIAKPNQATIISLARGFVFVALGVVILPGLFPTNGIWASILFAFLKRQQMTLSEA
jgi:Na+-driven multidrug efflux pump